MIHPPADQWMAFLYDELPRKAKRELHLHLNSCPACAAQVQTWRSAMSGLESWKLPRRQPGRALRAPALSWAAAAAAMLVISFFLGRLSSSATVQVAELRGAVARLSDLVRTQSAAGLSNTVAACTTAATEQTIQLLADYSRLQEEQRAAERESVNLALGGFNARLNRMNDDLETVAAGAETGFQETHENLTRVASLSLAAKN